MSLKIPDSYRQLLLDFAIQFYKKMPDDVLSFSIAYFKLLKERQDKSVKFGVTAGLLKPQVVVRGYNPDEEDDDDAPSNEFGKFPKTADMKKKLENSMKDNLLFRGLEREQMNTIIDAMKEVPVRVGDEIIRQGDDGDFFYVIDRGIYEAYISKEGESDSLIRKYENEGCFGELALMYDQPRSATIRAQTNGVVFSLDRNAFQKIVLKSAHERRKLHEELLGKVSLFQSLTSTEKQNIADVLVTVNFSNDQQIIKEGDAADGMYFVIAGSVKVTRIDDDEENVIKVINKGEYFGELALLNRKPRAANCFAVGDVKLAFLSAEAFERLMGPCLDVLQRHAAEYTTRISQMIGADRAI
ncbi:unnamed protein product [Nesidiocoris tenuis]|uniref:Cyclic nucleotide-binding domain-containing protein n=1 Tax=Nesidiocoris tenuis TaxID=355587 RepID=A0A6H5GWR4_9HEMI|nr:unnamed protein product [Nesidiocoris tenuis]